MNRLEFNIEKHGVKIVTALLVIGIVLIIYFSVSSPFNDLSFERDATLFSAYGDFIGGLVGSLFALVAIVLLYRTLIIQKELLDEQRSQITNIDRQNNIKIFENTLFNLLNAQQSITAEVTGKFEYLYTNNFQTKILKPQGRSFFIYSRYEFGTIWGALNHKTYLGQVNPEVIDDTIREIDSYFNPNDENYVEPYEAEKIEKKLRKELLYKHKNSLYEINKADWDEFRTYNMQQSFPHFICINGQAG